MKKRNLKLFIVIGSILAFLLAIEELFLILSSADILPRHIDENILLSMVIAPSIIVWLYGLLSIFQKSVNLLQVVLSGAAGLLVPADVTLCIYLIPYAGVVLGFVLCGIFAVAGIILFVYGFPKAKKSSSYGILCINAAYLPFACFTFGMISSHARLGAADAVWTMLLLPVLCAFIAADMVSAVKYRKFRELCESENQV